MIDVDILAYAMLGLSLSISAVQIGGWLLNANPRALLNAGRWSALGIVAATPLVLLLLVLSGRSSLAVMLAAFALPVFIEGARRWRGPFPPINIRRNWHSPMTEPRPIDPDLARQCAALLRAYVQQAERQIEQSPLPTRLPGTQGPPDSPMLTEEALEVLGLQPGASRDDVRDAHRQLRERLDPQSGGTRYLTMKIDEARDALLGL